MILIVFFNYETSILVWCTWLTDRSSFLTNGTLPESNRNVDINICFSSDIAFKWKHFKCTRLNITQPVDKLPFDILNIRNGNVSVLVNVVGGNFGTFTFGSFFISLFSFSYICEVLLVDWVAVQLFPYCCREDKKFWVCEFYSNYSNKNLIYLIFLVSGMVLCLALYHLGLTKNLVGVYCDIGLH